MLRLAVIAALTTAALAGAASTSRHLVFLRSVPADKAVLDSAPAAIRLYFNEKPLIEKTVLTLVDTAGHPATLEKPALVPSDSAPVIARVAGKLATGSYRVTWQSASPDGHTAKGTFRFTVK